MGEIYDFNPDSAKISCSRLHSGVVCRTTGNLCLIMMAILGGQQSRFVGYLHDGKCGPAHREAGQPVKK